jgi:hypothetical protein
MFVLIIFAGCATKDAVNRGGVHDNEEALKGRVMAYWDHRMKGDYDMSYEFEDPLLRKSLTRSQYIKRFAAEFVPVKKVRISSVKMADGRAEIVLVLTYLLRAPGAKEQALADVERLERWAAVDSEWFHVNERVSDKGVGKN